MAGRTEHGLGGTLLDYPSQGRPSQLSRGIVGGERGTIGALGGERSVSARPSGRALAGLLRASVARGEDISRIGEIATAMRMVLPVNILGLPSCAVPVGADECLAQGVQLIGAQFREDLLLDASQTIEDRAPTLTPIQPRVAGLVAGFRAVARSIVVTVSPLKLAMMTTWRWAFGSSRRDYRSTSRE